MAQRKFFTIVPHLVLDDERLSTQTRDLYVHYCRIVGAEMIDGVSQSQCLDGVDTTAKRLGMSSKTVIKARNQLEQLGYIKTERTYRRRDKRTVLAVRVIDVWEKNTAYYLEKYPPHRYPRKLEDIIIGTFEEDAGEEGQETALS